MEKFICKDYIDKDYVDNLLKTAIRIFDGEAPGSEGIELDENVTQEDWDCGLKKVVANHTLVPVLIPMIPENPNGMAIMVIPGGAYRRQVLSQEGVEVGKWLNSMGITAFVLRHRLPADLHNRRVDVPLIDAQRAIRYIRYNAEKYGICENRVGVMGFSAGGHLASLLSTCYDREVYTNEADYKCDDIDKLNARPDFSVLGYPAIAKDIFMLSKETRNYDTTHLVEMFTKYSTDELVTEKTPPAFIMETDDDTTTWAEHSVRYYLALRKCGVSGELHIFKQGKHGYGLGNTRKQVYQWQQLFVKWLEVLDNN